MEKLGCVIYGSLPGKGYTLLETETMLKTARESRKMMDITGVAIFADGMLLTLIEGEENNVSIYLKSLTKYLGVGLQNVVKLLEMPIQKRSFSQYCLAFKSYDENLMILDDFCEMEEKLYFEQFLAKNNPISNLVRTFITDHTA
jgi:hypothetical protein